MRRRERGEKRKRESDNGFEKWGGYMNAKISKLEAQYKEDQKLLFDKQGKLSNIFDGISIFVNGYTEPSADELRCLMLQHGGVYHHYYRSGKTTHIIASSLPNAKFNKMKNLKVVKCEWITDSIKASKLLDYKKYLLLNDLPWNSKSKQENILMMLNYGAGSSVNTKESEIPKTAADDGYLTDFYRNSRLHYISTLGAALKQHVQDLRDNHSGIFPGRIRFQQLQLEKTNDTIMEGFGGNIIMHIDMDCFFVAVALRNHPHLKGLPVAVTHSKGKPAVEDRAMEKKFERNFYKKKIKGKVSNDSDDDDDDDDHLTEEGDKERSSMSEIASCSYAARKAGVRKGMYLGTALKLCPNLKTVPYDFDGYREVSMALYDTVAEYTLDIEAISCDELFIDCTNLIAESKIEPLKFAEMLRKEILDKTSCTASAGIGQNKLLARLATKNAKPNGQFYLTGERIENFMRNLDVCELPGVGRTINAKLRDLSVKTCGDLQKLPLTTLKREFGMRTGEALYKHSRGEDDSKVNFSHERKSVSAEVNYGIRFNDNEETETFLKQLSEEVSKRLKDIKMTGKNITLKILFRAKNAPVETAKFLGHGVCDQVNRSVALPIASDDTEVISKHVIALYHALGVPPNELRGIGIQITKLESVKKNTKTLRDFLSDQKKKSASSTSSFLNKNGIVESSTASETSAAARPSASVAKCMSEVSTRLPQLKGTETEITRHKKSPNHKGNETKKNTKTLQDFLSDHKKKPSVSLSAQNARKIIEPSSARESSGTAQEFKPRAQPNNAMSAHPSTFSEIDSEVLASLPENIRMEVLKEYGFLDVVPKSECKSVKAVSTSEPVSRKNTCEKFFYLNINEMRTMMKDWVAAETRPRSYDVNMLKNYLLCLVQKENIERVSIIIRCLKRLIKSERAEDKVWNEIHSEITDAVQSGMKKKYGKVFARDVF